jgi:Cu-processing system permease protein
MRTLIIARLTFKEAARRRILLAALVLGLVFLAVFGIGFHYISLEFERSLYGPGIIEQNEILSFLFQAGLYVINFLTIAMTVLTSVDTISGEIQSGTIHTLVAKPMKRWEVVLGKWLGFAVMISLYLLLMVGGITLIVFLRSNFVIQGLLQALALMWLNALIMLSISLFGGTFLSTLANGVLVFGLYGVAFIGSWIEQIGSFLPNQATNQTTTNIGILTSLLIPAEALWKRAAYEVQSPLVSTIGFSPFVARSVPSLLMVVYAVLYLFIITFLAVRTFQRRDL